MSELWRSVTPVPKDAPIPNLPAGYEGFEYRQPDGQLFGLMCRYDDNGMPRTRSLMYAQNGSPDKRAWRWINMPHPRPLFNIHSVTAESIVLVVADERTATRVNALMQGTNKVAVAWAGGYKAVSDTDWTPLAGANVYIWPDKNEPCEHAAVEVAHILAPVAATVATVRHDPDWAPDTTLASLAWEPAAIMDYIAKHAEYTEAAPPEEPEGRAESAPAASATVAPPDEPPFPFTLLGHDHGIYFYLGHGSKQVTLLKANAHNSLNLLQLAPSSFWGRRWPAKRGFDADQAASDLITLQHRLGVYDPMRLRGRGAWWDREANTALIHLGDSLLINGAPKGLHEHGSRYIYECAVPIPFDMQNPLRKSEAGPLINVCDYISWENPTYGRLLAGWIVCAMVCGALRWRPNIWINAPAQAGKSTVFNHILARALGGMAKRFVGGVTEAALRNILKVDAMPILIDDMDSNSQRGKENIQAILSLMRVFSGEDGGDIAKGSQTGVATITRVNSCYAFSSILMSADDTASKSRIAILRIVPRPFEKGQLEELHAKIDAALPPEFAPRLYARCVNMLPTIRKNAEIFAQAIGTQTGQRRSGDLYGHLFAGAYSLHSDGLITPTQAADYIGSREHVVSLMREEKQAVVENNEGDRCLAHLLEQVLTTDTTDNRTQRISILELIQSGRDSHGVEPEHSRKLLRRNGIILKGEHFFVANDHTALRDFYKNSAWSVGWGGILKTVKGAEAGDRINFGGRVTRSVQLPCALLDEAPVVPAQAAFTTDDLPI